MDSDRKYNQPSVQELFEIIKNGTTAPNFTENELKSNGTERKPSALFVPLAIQKQFDLLPPDVKEKYKRYGDQYYNDVIDTITDSIDRKAKELLLTVKSGLASSDLTDDEKVILRNQYGPKWYELANLESE